MTCKDFLYYELCKYNTYQEAHYFGKDKEIYIMIDNNSPCKFFTTRSEWVHLPCKVGDTVFCLYDGDYGEYKVETMNIDTLCKPKIRVECNIHGYGKIEDCPEEFCGQPFCVGYFGADDFGKTVFLTREEAEKALEEKK